MARNSLIAVVAAMCMSAVAANFAEDLVKGSSGLTGGAMSLAEGGHLSKDAEDLVMRVGPIAVNRTRLFIEQYEEATDETLEVSTIEVESGVLGGLKAMSEGSELVHNASSAVNSLSEEEFLMASNNTYFYTMQLLIDNLVTLTNAVEDSFAAGTASAESTGNRKLLQNLPDCDTAESDEEVQQCYLDSLSSSSSSLASASDETYTRMYENHCEPYIMTTYSSTLSETFSDDKVMQTCNDDSIFNIFGRTRCSECISHFSERVGGTVTQEDCDTFSNDEQEWYLDQVNGGKFMMRDDEEDDHCVQAPSTDDMYSSQTYTMQRCDEGNKMQQFDLLELDGFGRGWTSDPRMMLRVSDSATSSLPGGMCMTTMEEDDDDEMPFVNKPCICSKSQIMKRDD